MTSTPDSLLKDLTEPGHRGFQLDEINPNLDVLGVLWRSVGVTKAVRSGIDLTKLTKAIPDPLVRLTLELVLDGVDQCG